MMNHCSRKGLSVCALCLVAVLVLTGCEPLRKKFTRQKKKDKMTDDKFIPVLEPQEYPVKQYVAQDTYAQHFSLFKVWFSDFAANYENPVNEKKLLYDLDTALKELDEMQKLLKAPASEELAKLAKQVQFIRDEFAKPVSFRNRGRIVSEIRSVDRDVRKKFNAAILKGSFIDQ